MNNIKQAVKYMHRHEAPSKGKILLVASSPTVSQRTGWRIGFWASELAHALLVFQEAGYGVAIVSTKGDKLEMDTYSNSWDASGYAAHDMIFLVCFHQDSFNERIRNTPKLTKVPQTDYDAIYLVGNQGNLITGQQQNSGAVAAEFVVDMLAK